MSSIVILGANGFLGRELLGAINISRSVKAVVRNIPTDVSMYQKNVIKHLARLKVLKMQSYQLI
jgi:dTDP-4-dehydrorhamnose reductase